MFLEPAPSGNPAVGLPNTPSRSQLPATARQITVWDYAGMLGGFLLTLAICVHNARGRLFWEDEMLGWMLLRDPSWHHMVRAWNLGADGGGFSFYLLGRAWFAVVGASVLSFRLFSATAFGLGFVAIWAGLRRAYPTWIVALAAFNTVFFSPPLLMHFLEGRFYGLLFMATALALWLALVLNEAPEPTPKRLFVLAFLVHALLTTSHLLGVVFSGFILGGTVLLDFLSHRRRLGLYLSIAASWLLLLPEHASIVAAGKVGKPHFWTHAPDKWDLIGVYSGFSREIQVVLVVLAALAVYAFRSSAAARTNNTHAIETQRRAALIIGLSLLVAPLAFLAQGLLGGTWLFNSRYMQPITIGLAYITAELLAIIHERLTLPAWLSHRSLLRSTGIAAAVTAWGLLLLVWDFHHVAMLTPEVPEYTAALTAHMPHNLPVVAEDAFTFTELLSRQSNSGVHYTFLLDWPFAVSAAAPRLEVTQFHLMQNWLLAGYFPHAIQELPTFLRDNPRFLVIHNGPVHPDPRTPPEIGNPLAERLSHDPDYQVIKYFTLDRAFHDNQRETVWLVCRGSCGEVTAALPKPSYCVLWAANTPCCSDQACLAALPPKVKKAIE